MEKSSCVCQRLCAERGNPQAQAALTCPTLAGTRSPSHVKPSRKRKLLWGYCGVFALSDTGGRSLGPRFCHGTQPLSPPEADVIHKAPGWRLGIAPLMGMGIPSCPSNRFWGTWVGKMGIQSPQSVCVGTTQTHGARPSLSRCFARRAGE